MTFDVRPPSSTWEAVSLPSDPPLAVWGWFKPPHAPTSVALTMVPELWNHPAASTWLTVRELSGAVGIDWLHGWTIYGQFCPLDERTAAFIDQPLQPPRPGADALVILWAHVAVPASLPAMVAPVAGTVAGGASDLAPGEDPTALFEMMASHWTAVLQAESDLRRIRMQLEQSASRLSSLNRDLNSDEANAADTNDKKDWQDARRFLRDSASGLSRSIKEIDVGIISGAGQRNRFEELYRNYVEPRVVFAGMKQAAVDFEMHFRTVKNTLQSAQAALSKGSADGERRANVVLQRIAGKVRLKRNKARQ